MSVPRRNALGSGKMPVSVESAAAPHPLWALLAPVNKNGLKKATEYFEKSTRWRVYVPFCTGSALPGVPGELFRRGFWWILHGLGFLVSCLGFGLSCLFLFWLLFLFWHKFSLLIATRSGKGLLEIEQDTKNPNARTVRLGVAILIQP